MKGDWPPQEVTRFYRAFLKYGTEFDKVSKSVGGGKTPEACEAMYRQHQAYLSLDRKFQSEVAFVAMVQDALNHLKEDSPAAKALTGSQGAAKDEPQQPPKEEEIEGGEVGGGSSGPAAMAAAAAASEGGRPYRARARAGAAAAAAAAGEDMDEEFGLDEEDTEDDSHGAVGGRMLAATRARRTPKRLSGIMMTPPGSRAPRRTPQSSAKRQRGTPRDDDIYEYYDPAVEVVTESARRRRASQKRLEFGGHHHQGPSGPAAGAGGRRREAADEAKGIDALLSLAVAGEEFEGGELGAEEEQEEAGGAAAGAAAAGAEEAQAEDETGAGAGEPEEEGELAAAAAAPPLQHRRKPPPARKRRKRSVEEEIDTEEEMEEELGESEGEEEGGGEGVEAMEEGDEDYSEHARTRRRRTPTSTPLRARSRPGSTHATPRRTGLRGLTSPGGLRGLGSPAWLGLSDTELGMGELGIPDLSYLSSPGFMTALPPGYVPSPKNPMPRLRRRKYAPTKSPPVVSPFKSLFGSRRQSLVGGPTAPSFLNAAFGSSSFAAAAGAAAGARDGGKEEGVVMSPVEVQLRHCLNARTRRWCQFEFFYSAIDRPWFMQNGLQGLLSHLGLGSGSQLTRKEWDIVRAGLGKPRRLSIKFLKEERARLEAWRESVRAHYAATGAPGALPVDPTIAVTFPRALNVGQRVTARHPTTRQIHDGSVLTAAPNSYRIQFDRRELGVELVRDYDIMPSDPAENLPHALLAANPVLLLNGRYVVGGQPVRPPAPRTIFPLHFSSIPAVTPAAAAAAAAFARAPQHQQQLLMQQALQQQQAQAPALPLPAAAAAETPGSVGTATAASDATPASAPLPDSVHVAQQVRAPVSAAEAQALSELAVTLDKKEALLVQLRAMNDEAAAGVHAVRGGAAPGGSPSDTSQAFKLAYAKVVLQLRDTNERVAAKLMELESLRNAEPGSDLKLEAAGAKPGSATQAPVAPPLPDTAESLAASALQDARSMVAACRRKLADAAAEAARRAKAGEQLPVVPGQQQQQQPTTQGMDWDVPPGRLLGGVIEGCVWSLLALQRGCASGVPAATLAGALETALHAVQPHAAGNQQLFNDIKQAMDALKAQLMVA